MRRSLILLSLATTALVVISLIVPLGLLVQRQAADTAKVEAERRAQSLAALLALALAVDTNPEAVEEAIGSPPLGTIVLLPGNSMIGRPAEGQGTLVDLARATGGTVSMSVDGGWETALPVVASDGTAVVDVFVSDEMLDRGVVAAWLLLAALGIALVAAAVWVADRLGQRLVGPITALAQSARRLADGDLDARARPVEPPEVREVGEAFNYLADRLDQLLIEERESVADLSHRLRTPLTSLRLQAESLEDADERASMMAQVDRLERSVDQLIELARDPAAAGPSSSDLNEVVRDRMAFWEVLADEQERELQVELDPEASRVAMGSDPLGAMIDVLIENVFVHAPAGTPLKISTAAGPDGRTWLEVADRGPGFGNLAEVKRGVSGRGSTGLGLDIVRKAAESVGGSIELNDRPGGGAVVRVWLG